MVTPKESGIPEVSHLAQSSNGNKAEPAIQGTHTTKLGLKFVHPDDSSSGHRGTGGACGATAGGGRLQRPVRDGRGRGGKRKRGKPLERKFQAPSSQGIGQRVIRGDQVRVSSRGGGRRSGAPQSGASRPGEGSP